MTLIMSLVGMVTLIAIALLFSYDRTSIRLRTVVGAFAIQAGIGALVLYVPAGQAALQTISAGVSQVVLYANDGIDFLFGGLADIDQVGFVFAIRVLPVIIFFSSLIAVLYYLGIMQWVVRPFIAKMTPSQLFAVMCGGLASASRRYWPAPCPT